MQEIVLKSIFLKDDSEALSEIIKLSADAIISIDENYDIVLFNNAAQTLFGYSEDEILGKPLELLLPPSLRLQHKVYIKAFDKDKINSRRMGERNPVWGHNKKGEAVFLDISIIKHPKSSPIKFSAVCRDISVLLEKERQIAENEEKFRVLFNASHQLVILLDVKGHILDINATGKKLLGEIPTSYLGTRLQDSDFWATEQDRSLINQIFLDLHSRKTHHEVVSITNRHNEQIVIDIVLKVISLTGKSRDIVVLEGRDVTERVKANISLAESENRLSRAQKIARIGNWEWDIENNTLSWSDEIYNIFELTKSSFGATYESFLERIHPDDRQSVEDAVNQALYHHKPYSITHKIICPDGNEKVVHEIGEILRTEDGAPIRMEGTVQDITIHWQREQELIEAKNKAEKANLAKMQFLATMSHELRTPLNAIIGFSALIGDQTYGELDGGKYVEYANYINESGEHLLSLINDILDVSRLELEAVKLEPVSFSVSELIDESIKFILGKSQEKNIHINTSYPEDLKNVKLDKKLCKQIVINLLSNAIKFSFCNGIIAIKVKQSVSQTEIVVIDNGIGLDEDDLELIFKPFSQTGCSYLSGNEGVGLGLTIVKNLVEIQQGTISVKSERNVETKFTVSLPNVLEKN